LQLPILKIGNLKPRYPIVQGGMAVRISTAPLSGTVAKAGGIGIIGATGMDEDELRREIRQAKQLAEGGIVGINIMFAARKFKEMVQVALEEKIDVIFTGAGFSREIFSWGKKAGVPIVSIVSSAKAALLAEKCGAAAVVSEGFEAGGHLGTERSINEILPEIVAAVKIPVIAAGGIVDGAGMAEMFKMGASGVQMGTRFVLSQECTVADEFKQAYLQAQEEDVVIIKSPVGFPGRALYNTFVKQIETDMASKPDKCAACLKSCSHDYCIMCALENSSEGRVDEGVIFAGKNVFKIKDILSVEEIFRQLLADFEENWNTRAG
jgi:nitronate monooxygenase